MSFDAPGKEPGWHEQLQQAVVLAATHVPEFFKLFRKAATKLLTVCIQSFDHAVTGQVYKLDKACSPVRHESRSSFALGVAGRLMAGCDVHQFKQMCMAAHAIEHSWSGGGRPGLMVADFILLTQDLFGR